MDWSSDFITTFTEVDAATRWIMLSLPASSDFWQAFGAIATAAASIIALYATWTSRKTALALIVQEARLRDEHERIALASALQVELQAWRKAYSESMADATRDIPADGAILFTIDDYALAPALTGEFPVYQNAAGRIGLFRPEATGSVVKAYSSVRVATEVLRKIEGSRDIEGQVLIHDDDGEVTALMRAAEDIATACTNLDNEIVPSIVHRH